MANNILRDEIATNNKISVRMISAIINETRSQIRDIDLMMRSCPEFEKNRT